MLLSSLLRFFFPLLLYSPTSFRSNSIGLEHSPGKFFQTCPCPLSPLILRLIGPRAKISPRRQRLDVSNSFDILEIQILEANIGLPCRGGCEFICTPPDRLNVLHLSCSLARRTRGGKREQEEGTAVNSAWKGPRGATEGILFPLTLISTTQKTVATRRSLKLRIL